ncbi:MAG: glycosyltransferase family 2 protein [Thiohalomonadales bacterium]
MNHANVVISDILLTVVIINYRTASMVVKCLESLLPELDNKISRIALVDNASGDNSSEIIEEWLSSNDTNSLVRFIQSPSNSGFSSGNNIGIKVFNSKLYLLLNSDTLIRKGAIKQLLKTASEHDGAGIITPRLEWRDGRPQESCFNFHSPISEFISSAQTGFFTALFSKYSVPIPVSENITIPEWSSFACVLIRREVFADIGFMDDGYFMYFEDAEFCSRAKKSGWKVINEPLARVVHLRGGSSPVKENTRLHKRLPRYYYESRTRFFYQTYGWIGLTTANLFWTMGRVISMARQILGRSDKAVNQRQWLDIWINWLKPLTLYIHPDNYK